MSELAPQIPELGPETVGRKAEEFYGTIIDSFNAILPHGKHRQISDTQILLGDGKNFLNLLGVGTERLHLIVGKTPIVTGKGHFHLDLAHLLHLTHHDDGEVEEEGKDPNAFDAWEAVVDVGASKEITYASHQWRSGEEKGKKILVSPSGGIQTNNEIALQGIEDLLPHIRL